MKTIIFFIIMILSSFGGVGGGLYSQITLIPDPNFEQALIDLGIDSDGIVNGQVLTADIEGVEVLDVSNIGIQDMTGIEDFSSLRELNVSENYNGFYHLDLSGNPLLEKIDFRRNYNLMTINLSNNPLLEYIISDISLLSELDVSNNPLLKVLQIGTPDEGGVSEANIIESLDLSNNPLLVRLWLVDITPLNYINLKSGGNELLTDVYIMCHIEGVTCGSPLCIEVDDVNAAQSNQPPYNSWDIFYEINVTYSEDCSLSVPALNKMSVKVYPNPIVDELFVYNPTGDPINVDLYTLSGQLLLQKQFNHTNNMLSTKDIEAGTYFLVIKDTSGQKTVKKVVKK